MTTVLDVTVASVFCSGCGVCAGICPSHVLKMKMNEYGEFNPVRVDACKKECELCIKVCPFANGNDNEDIIGKKSFGSVPSIQHKVETGYYLSSGIGAVSDEGQRMSSTSGGLATWFLAQLLKNDVVDAVICASHTTPDDHQLFSFTIARTPEEVYSAKGSVYYPLEISRILHYIQKNNLRYAIIGLPCVLKGIRLAQEKFQYLKERIVVLVGLACSNLKSSYFTEYAAYYSGLHETISHCTFRHKTTSLPANYFRFKFTGVNGARTEIDWGRNQLWDMYFGRCFTLHSCDCCDDMHAECADVTFMDAWLPECAEEPRGTSLWIARSTLAEQILEKGIQENTLDASHISIEKVIQAQSSLRWKREMLKYRLLLMIERGENCPQKRVAPEMGNLTFIERDKVRNALYIQRESRLRYADGFDAIGKWFDEAYANRPFLVRVWYFVTSIPSNVYWMMARWPWVQMVMRRVRSIGK